MGRDLLAEINFDGDGLVPCVVQDFDSGEVLMLAYMNREALQKTLSSGQTHFWSRSRGELWHKGATSGNTQQLRELRYDCDGDALIALVEPTGPACHTGEQSCFFRALDSDVEAPRTANYEALATLARTVKARRDRPPAGSYTAELIAAGVERIAEKVEEEATEVVQAALAESDARLVAEAADLLYHLSVLLGVRDLDQSAVMAELVSRMKK